MSRTEQTELTVMVMVQKKGTDLVAVEKRKKGQWDGLIFPGGHVERGESFARAAVREAEEETGLTISALQFCGVVHWAHKERKERYLVMLYRAEGEGELLPATAEGENIWMPLAEFCAAEGKSPAMDEYLSCFLGETGELFAEYDDGGTDTLVRQQLFGTNS